MFQRSTSNIILALFLIGFAIAFRVIPHPANFAPVGAIALMGGLLMARQYAIWLPVAIMAFSDLIIGTHPLILWTWGSFALIALLSSTFLRERNIGAPGIVAAALSGGLLFFFVTNFGVWLQSGMYAHTWEGLVQCYVNALPFLRNTLLGDVFFSTSMYAIYIAVKGTDFKRFLPQQFSQKV